MMTFWELDGVRDEVWHCGKKAEGNLKQAVQLSDPSRTRIPVLQASRPGRLLSRNPFTATWSLRPPCDVNKSWLGGTKATSQLDKMKRTSNSGGVSTGL